MNSVLAQNETICRHEPSALDLWLQRGLKQRYGHVTREPLPDQFLRLLEDPAPKLRKEQAPSV